MGWRTDGAYEEAARAGYAIWKSPFQGVSFLPHGCGSEFP